MQPIPSLKHTHAPLFLTRLPLMTVTRQSHKEKTSSLPSPPLPVMFKRLGRDLEINSLAALRAAAGEQSLTHGESNSGFHYN